MCYQVGILHGRYDKNEYAVRTIHSEVTSVIVELGLNLVALPEPFAVSAVALKLVHMFKTCDAAFCCVVLFCYCT